MDNSYQDQSQAENYNNFLNSKNGTFQKQLILKAVLEHLPKNQQDVKILDLGSGPGWLSHELSNRGFKTVGCDASTEQINLAKKNYPGLEFFQADPEARLPFLNEEFNVIIASLVLCDLENQPAALTEISRVLKPSGKFINIIPNPYYAYPVGSWKRGFFGKLFGLMPKLKLKNYFDFFKNENREFVWQNNLPSRFYPLSEQINNLIKTGYKITRYNELKSDTDDKKFSRQYQTYRFPLYLLIEANKTKVTPEL